MLPPLDLPLDFPAGAGAEFVGTSTAPEDDVIQGPFAGLVDERDPSEGAARFMPHELTHCELSQLRLPDDCSCLVQRSGMEQGAFQSQR